MRSLAVGGERDRFGIELQKCEGIGNPEADRGVGANEGLGRTLYRLHEVLQLLNAELPVRSDTGAEIEAEGLDRMDRGLDVGGVQAPGKEHRNRDLLPYPPADLPVVHPAGSAQLLDCQRGISRVEKQCVHVTSDLPGLIDRVLTQHVNDLNKLDMWQLSAKPDQLSWLKGVHELKG